MKIKIEKVGMIKIYCDGMLMIEEETIEEVVENVEEIYSQIDSITEKIIVEKIRIAIKAEKEWVGVI